jgi:hypothetical protein
MEPAMALLSTTHRPPGGIHWLVLLALTQATVSATFDKHCVEKN